VIKGLPLALTCFSIAENGLQTLAAKVLQRCVCPPAAAAAEQRASIAARKQAFPAMHLCCKMTVRSSSPVGGRYASASERVFCLDLT
jgi:hypothetical protein